jgi:hypothetical protein
MRFTLLVVLIASAGFGQTPKQNPALIPVGVFMDFESLPGPGSLAAMEAEANDLLKASGLKLDWRLAKENRGDQAFAGLVFLKFTGSCRADAIPPASRFGTLGEVHSLGFTEVSHGRVLPFSQVECDEVRRALAYLRPATGFAERQRALGRALGRVVAHELYHILARTTSHGTKGLAQPEQSLEDLVSERRLALAQKDARAIGDALRPAHSSAVR